VLAVAVLLTGGAAVAATQGWVEPTKRPAVLDSSSSSTAQDQAQTEAGSEAGTEVETQAQSQDVVPALPALERDRPTAAERRRARLAELAEKAARERKREKREEAAAPTTSFRVASINTLGDSHTRPGGNKPRYASGPDRTRTLLGVLTSQGIDVAGLQEFERPQKATFNNIAPAWDVFTGTERGRDSIAYRNDVWDYVAGGTGTIPYFRGNPAPLPWVTLRHEATGREMSFISIHNPTSNPRRGNNAGHRAEATRREIAMVRSLAEGGNPVFLLGDFNERAEAFCMVTSGGDIGAANGGSVGGGCAPPPNMGIDWIFGTTDIAFSDYLRHQDATVNRMSDHPVIVANATITEPLP
jgi:hypothetical protein